MRPAQTCPACQGLPCSGKTPPVGGGGTKVPKGEWLSAKQTERLFVLYNHKKQRPFCQADKRTFPQFLLLNFAAKAPKRQNRA